MIEEKNPSDEELVTKSRAGDRDAEEQLLKRYSDVVKREVRFLYLVGAETEDLVQEGMIGLVKAIRDYTADRGASFHTYATSCIRNQIRTAITAAGRKKHQPLNGYISIYADSAEQGEQLLSEQAGGGRNRNPETLYLQRESLEELQDRINSRLSPLEQRVSELFLEGYSHAEIAKRLDKPERSVNNALTRIRNKLKGEKG